MTTPREQEREARGKVRMAMVTSHRGDCDLVETRIRHGGQLIAVAGGKPCSCGRAAEAEATLNAYRDAILATVRERVVTPVQLRTMYAVMRWNSSPDMHALTCGHDSRHGSLVPVPVGDEVHLWCVDCNYRQTHIPPVVLATLTPEPTDGP